MMALLFKTVRQMHALHFAMDTRQRPFTEQAMRSHRSYAIFCALLPPWRPTEWKQQTLDWKLSECQASYKSMEIVQNVDRALQKIFIYNFHSRLFARSLNIINHSEF